MILRAAAKLEVGDSINVKHEQYAQRWFEIDSIGHDGRFMKIKLATKELTFGPTIFLYPDDLVETQMK